VAYWNKTKGFVDVMSRLMSHIKIPFKSGGPVLQLVFRFMSIMVVNGYLTTCLLKLKNEDFETDDSYNSVRKKIANETSLNDYVKVLAKHFELPDCMFQDPNNGEVVNEEQGQLEFGDLPTNRLLNPGELKKFKSVIAKKRKLYKVFNKGLAKKIRLEPRYRHNMEDAKRQGRCVFCSSQNTTNWPKYKCKTCGVFLCRTIKGGNRSSCVEKWHSRQDLAKYKST
jgi:hypothetical protein